MKDSFEREHPDPLDGDLPPLAIDRQRVVHCAAFRRLQRKTQVFVAPDSDHFRTRLTHTLEVAHQARILAERVGLDPLLAEVVALAHDLGHPPFGHAGERALDRCMHHHGGFEHNRHTLRIVEQLEHPYPDFRGLNLTRVVRCCLARHSTRYDQPGLDQERPPPPESLIVDLSDRLACVLHDAQDGLYAGLITLEQLGAADLWRRAYDGPGPDTDAWRGYLRPAVDRIEKIVRDDVVKQSSGSAQADALLSAEVETGLAQLEQLLFEHLYRHPDLVEADARARHTLTDVFDLYVSQPDLLPARFRARIEDQGKQPVVADYVAGMTDRFCFEQHAQMTD
jgi:dGTPase